MPPTSTPRNSIARAVAAPTLLVCILSAALCWQAAQLAAASRSSPEWWFGLVLGISILLACLCWWQLLVRSRTLFEMEKTLQDQGERLVLDELEQAAEAMQHYAIFMLDPKGHVASWDRDAERLLGYLSSDVMTRHLSMFYGEADARQGKPAHDLVVAASDGRLDDDRWMVRKDGFRFKASVALIAIRDPSGDLCGFTNVVREEVQDSSGSSAGFRL
jgi:PAS domain S-box-containing protein